MYGDRKGKLIGYGINMKKRGTQSNVKIITLKRWLLRLGVTIGDKEGGDEILLIRVFNYSTEGHYSITNVLFVSH